MAESTTACPACTFANPPTAVVCGVCETPLAAAPVKACAFCTLENEAHASACIACGAWWCARCTTCVPADAATCPSCGYPDEDEPEEEPPGPPTGAGVTPEDLARPKYSLRRVEKALARASDGALEDIVRDPARLVALACGEIPRARAAGAVVDPERLPEEEEEE
eukprot:CAMPEP_0119264714 /NCGR_PEP_ID=MMETSP1329-20130426/3732_1 /TAXON_ID=114041 /ORGANISM="Genus nov. species nov., Strain RCC1024" /LENGTH=164 /DNA_ID=CAMNT_0007264505 /DNA_START=108 /DNA_END=599 /DNA_ORIENTATION=+